MLSDASAQADALSEEWDALDAAFLAAEGETPPALVQEARELASVNIIVHALARSVIWGRDGRANVAAAHLLHDLIVLAFEVETAAHRKREPGASVRSFQIGLAHGIRHQLHAMKTERDAANHASGARELVPIKRSVIEKEMEKLALLSRKAARTPAQGDARRL